MEQEQPVRVGRRLAAIVAADVAGYSRLMHCDEEATHAKLRTLLTDAVAPTIAVHGGRIVKNTGDGFLAEFPSAVEAVRAATQFQNRVKELSIGEAEERRIAFRVGINIGDIIVEPHDIFGDGVNIAARLEGIAEPGGICLSSSAYDQVHGKVPVNFTDLGEQALKNIARPIRAYAVGLGANAHQIAPQPSSAPRLSIVVLPFANIGGDAEQEHFADGVTESLTTDLSRLPGVFAVARNTAFTFKGKAVDVKQVGQELRVRYVLEGSVQRGGNRLRLNVQLVDVETGQHFWSERFDKPVADLFDLQDEIVSRLANSLRYQLAAAEARRSEHVLNPTSMDLYFQGWQHLNIRTTPDAVLKARECFERALVLDPDNIDALIGKASVHAMIGQVIIGNESAPHLAAAEAALTDALSKNPQHPIAHLVLGSVYTVSGRALQGIAECERALAIDRNLASAHAFIGRAKLYLGRDEETEAHVNEALRLSPNDTFAFWWMIWAGFSKLGLGKFADAAVWFRRAIEANRNTAWLHLGLAAALVQVGALEEARGAIKEALALDPNCSLRLLRARIPHINSTVQESLRAAGLPE